MTFSLKIFSSFSIIKSIQDLYKSIEKSEGNTKIFLKKTHNCKKWATLENFGFAKSSPNSNVFQWVQVQTLAPELLFFFSLKVHYWGNTYTVQFPPKNS